MNIFTTLLKKVKSFLGGSSPANKPEKSEKPVRNYITLHFGKDGKVDGTSEGLPDDFFEEDDPMVDLDMSELDDYYAKESEGAFIASCILVGAAVVGLITIIGRLLVYPYIKQLEEDDFMG